MAVRKNTSKSPAGAKRTTTKSPTKKTSRTGKSTAKKKPTPQPADERLGKVLGVLVVLIALLISIAFFSYFKTWEDDQDIATSFDALLNKEVMAANALGKLGAIIANGAFFWGFGVASIGFVIILFKIGFDLILQKSMRSSWSWMRMIFFLIVLLSIGLSIFNYSNGFPWEGAFGKGIYSWLHGLVGRIGSILIVVFSLIGALVWKFNPNFQDVSVPNPDINLPKGKVKTPTLNIKEKVTGFFAKVEDEDIDVEDVEDKEEEIDSDGFDIVPSMAAGAAAVTATAALVSDVDKPKIETSTGDPLDLEVPTRTNKKGERLRLGKTIVPDLEVTTPRVPGESLEPDHPFEVVKTDVTPANTETQAETKLELNKQESTVPEQMTIDKENEEDKLEPYDPTKDLSSYQHPTLDLLQTYEGKIEIDRDELEANKNQIIETLRNYKIEITKIRATIGPTVTLYEIVPAPGIKISKIKNLEDDIALSLAALGIRIIAPIPGKGTIGIEVPNKKKQIVSLKEILDSKQFQESKMALPIALGKTISNDIFIADLAKMPHLLIAGATGQGKSVGINTILMSLLYKKHPSQVKLVMVDPKKVELFPYSTLDKHFLGSIPDCAEPIITDTSKVVETLNSLCIEMDERYDLLKAARARNIKEYNEKFIQRKLNPNNGHKFLPYIVLVIDEFADLMMTAGKEVEVPIARLAQLARAIGIHLIIATQRPSVNIITGIIKANFPARLAFKVTSKVDSRTILDAGGADQLIGKGDMLLSEGSDIVRIQCAFVDTPEVERVIDHISDQQGYGETYQLPEFRSDEDLGESTGNLKFTDLDEKLPEAARLIIGNQHGSTSSIQRGLQLGYNRAGRIMDQLESLGIVGPQKGSKPREVLYYSLDEFENFWENLKNNNQPRIS